MLSDQMILLLLLGLSAVIPHCTAQTMHTFNWGFSPPVPDFTVPQCANMHITLSPPNLSTNSIGPAPYFVLAFEGGGVPTVTGVGSDPNNLTWPVRHKEGASLLITMLDANGNTAGTPEGIFNVTAGDSSCLPIPPLDAAKIQANVTSILNTCEPWGLTITGGSKPYQIVIAALDSPVITNITMGQNDDVYTYIDRVDRTQPYALAAVVDATGQWGISSPIVPTGGASDARCIGLGSTSTTTAQIAAQAAARDVAAIAASHRRRTILLGVLLGLGLPLLLLCVYGVWWWRRYKLLASGIWDGQDVRPRKWSTADSTTSMIRSLCIDSPSPSFVLQSPGMAHVSSGIIHMSPGVSPTYVRNNSYPTTFPHRPQERHISLSTSLVAHSQSHATIDRKSSLPIPLLRAAVVAPIRRNSAPPVPSQNVNLIIQHQDGGVVELPPPYLDLSREGLES